MPKKKRCASEKLDELRITPDGKVKYVDRLQTHSRILEGSITKILALNGKTCVAAVNDKVSAPHKVIEFVEKEGTLCLLSLPDLEIIAKTTYGFGFAKKLVQTACDELSVLFSDGKVRILAVDNASFVLKEEIVHDQIVSFFSSCDSLFFVRAQEILLLDKETKTVKIRKSYNSGYLIEGEATARGGAVLDTNGVIVVVNERLETEKRIAIGFGCDGLVVAGENIFAMNSYLYTVKRHNMETKETRPVFIKETLCCFTCRNGFIYGVTYAGIVARIHPVRAPEVFLTIANETPRISDVPVYAIDFVAGLYIVGLENGLVCAFRARKEESTETQEDDSQETLQK